MGIFDDWVKLGLETLLLGGGFTLMGLGRRSDERLTAVAHMDRTRAMMEVGKRGKVGFGYPQVGAIAVGLWVCLVMFGVISSEEPGSSNFADTSLAYILNGAMLLFAVLMLQSKYTLDAVLFLLGVIVLGSVSMITLTPDARPAGFVHLIAASLGWTVSTVRSLSFWGVRPLNRITRPHCGEQIVSALLVACLGDCIAELAGNGDSISTWSASHVVTWRTGIISLVLGSWAAVGQGVFVRSVLGMCLMTQGILLMSITGGNLREWEFLGLTCGIDAMAGFYLWRSYRLRLRTNETDELAAERTDLVNRFEHETRQDVDSQFRKSANNGAQNGLAVANR